MKPQLRKIDDRSRKLVHLGTEPGSKAYRLLDPQACKIVVSRDVVFNESNGWNWGQREIEHEQDGTFSIIIGAFGNRGIQSYTDTDQPLSTAENQQTFEASHEEGEDVSGSGSHEPEVENEEGQLIPNLRRSERQSIKPKYLEDYILLAKEEGELLLLDLNNEPRNFNEAKGSKEWVLGCEDEIYSISLLLRTKRGVS